MYITNVIYIYIERERERSFAKQKTAGLLLGLDGEPVEVVPAHPLLGRGDG